MVPPKFLIYWEFNLIPPADKFVVAHLHFRLLWFQFLCCLGGLYVFVLEWLRLLVWYCREKGLWVGPFLRKKENRRYGILKFGEGLQLVVLMGQNLAGDTLCRHPSCLQNSPKCGWVKSKSVKSGVKISSPFLVGASNVIWIMITDITKLYPKCHCFGTLF